MKLFIVHIENDVIQYKLPIIGQYTDYQWQANIHLID